MRCRSACRLALALLLAGARGAPSAGWHGAASCTRRALLGSAVLLPAASARAVVRYAPARYTLVPQGSVRDKEERLAEVTRELMRKAEDPYLLGEQAQLEYDLDRLRENAAAVRRIRGCAASGGAIAASLRVRVPDLAAARRFWLDGLKMSELRSSRVGPDGAEGIVVGYGREGLDEDDGGKFSLELVQASARAPAPARLALDAPDAEAAGALLYVQLRVPNVRISGLVQSGGAIESAYGYVEVTSPGGLAVRVITAPRRDPVEFVALRVPDVEAAAAYYERAFGMRRIPSPPRRTERGPGVLGTGLFGREYEVQDDVLAPKVLYGSVLMVSACCGQADSAGVLLVPPSATTAPLGLRLAGGDGDPVLTVRAADVSAARKAALADADGFARDPSGARVCVSELRV
ncbi:hypothetical protein KFE25_007982 [Diacronema lutheri]|uniref:Peptidylprolyl isomerase n=2 Tax=Diacronema lutheri TaxID=2081491 RepID=A0A8J5XKT4_DIALT|nr:hypothetical protein KFE25_007982 [Diacronema lutheri]